jgi:EAL domain-containing protein (putative c-di-GMP-specific phosphodiesterase class I)
VIGHGLSERILEPGALSVRFQSVYEVRGHTARRHYDECLIRGPQGTSVECPDILFEYARKKNCEAVLDRACIQAVLRAASRSAEDVVLGINVHASTLAMDPEFVSFLADTAGMTGIAMERLVIEIVEHSPPWDVRGFRNSLEGLRSIGARIALDDIGLGQSNFMMILECRPDYFKIDRYFVHGARNDFYRQAVLASVCHLARPFGARVVAEGVETPEDLEAVQAAGIELVQGFLFGQPRSAPGALEGRIGGGGHPRDAEDATDVNTQRKQA